MYAVYSPISHKHRQTEVILARLFSNSDDSDGLEHGRKASRGDWYPYTTWKGVNPMAGDDKELRVYSN